MILGGVNTGWTFTTPLGTPLSEYTRDYHDDGIFIAGVSSVAGLISCVSQILPTCGLHGRDMAGNQPAAAADMEGLFCSQKGARIVLWTARD